AFISPGQIGATPGKAAAESGKDQPVARLEMALIVPQAQRDRRRCRVSVFRSEEHTSELQSLTNLVCRLLLEKKNIKQLNSLLPLSYLYCSIFFLQCSLPPHALHSFPTRRSSDLCLHKPRSDRRHPR